jgi:hypothetical protein
MELLELVVREEEEQVEKVEQVLMELRTQVVVVVEQKDKEQDKEAMEVRESSSYAIGILLGLKEPLKCNW